MEALRLSAILNMVVDFESIRKTVRHLCRQTVREQLELVIVTTPAKKHWIEDRVLEPLGAWQVVTIDCMPTAAASWAAGIAAARAPIVVLCEDHSFPEPNWAEALLDAHKQDCAAVAPAIQNGNPSSLISWANFLLCFSDWFMPDESGAVPSGPGHNTSYKKAALLPYSDLETWLNPERVLHFDLASRGQRILLEKRAVTHHVNLSFAKSYFQHCFLGGRVFGASRSAHWSKTRAWLQSVLFPLVPPLRLFRMLKVLNSPSKRSASRFWAALPLIMIGLTLHALGEAVGYTIGQGDAMDRYMSFEVFRSKHVNERDQPTLMDAPRSRAASSLK